MAKALSKPEESFLADFWVALLAVSKYSIKRATLVVANLRGLGIFEPAAIEQLSADDVTARLVNAGHDRGEFVNRQMGRRIRTAAEALSDGAIRQALEFERNGEIKKLTKLLQIIPGVGPRVIENLLTLRPPGDTQNRGGN